MADLITASLGQAHITPKNDAVWHRAMVGAESCILDYGSKLAPQTIPTQPTNIRIMDGCGMFQGRFFEVDPYDTIAIPNGAQNQNRIDIVCARITQNEDGTQSFSWLVVTGNPVPMGEVPTAPLIEAHSLDDGDEYALMPIASVRLEGVNIVAVETVADILTSSYAVTGSVTAGTVLWKYRKYADGTLEMWGSATTTLAIATARGEIFTTANEYDIAMPAFVNSIDFATGAISGGAWVSVTALNVPPKMRLYAPTSYSSASRALRYYVRGTWK